MSPIDIEAHAHKRAKREFMREILSYRWPFVNYLYVTRIAWLAPNRDTRLRSLGNAVRPDPTAVGVNQENLLGSGHVVPRKFISASF
jgi:hypothetical protein